VRATAPLALFGVAALALYTAFACGSFEPSPVPREGIEWRIVTPTRDTLVIAVPSDFQSLLPPVSSSIQDSYLQALILEPPYEVDFDCELEFHRGTAKEFGLWFDKKEISVTLRDDLRWQDGTPVTARDHAETYRLVAEPAVASPRTEYLRRLEPAARPRVVDDHHLLWRFTESYDGTTMKAHTGLAAVPAHRLQGVDLAAVKTHELNTGIPLASGPWKVTARERDVRLVLEPNEMAPPDLHPQLSRVVFKTVPDYATRVVELVNGTVDMVEGLSVEDAGRIAREHPEIRLHRRGWRAVEFVAWNGQAEGGPHALFGSRDLRRALTRAVDIDKLIRDLLTGSDGAVYGRPAVGTITPALCGAHADGIARIPFDPAGARAELDALGWTDHDGDGVRDKDGRALRFPLLVSAGNTRRAAVATLLQANLHDVGVDMQIEEAEAAALSQRVRERRFDAVLTGIGASLFVDPTNAWTPGGSMNLAGYDNPSVTALTAAGLRERDPARSNTTWQQLQATIYDDQPFTFLYWMDEIVGLSDRFNDTRIDILSPYHDLHRWWVPPERVKYPS
jgi:peptide/nickel transport system substrate-binding protein